MAVATTFLFRGSLRREEFSPRALEYAKFFERHQKTKIGCGSHGTGAEETERGSEAKQKCKAVRELEGKMSRSEP